MVALRNQCPATSENTHEEKIGKYVHQFDTTCAALHNTAEYRFAKQSQSGEQQKRQEFITFV